MNPRSLLACILLLPLPGLAAPVPPLDTLHFGDPASEKAHAFQGEATVVVTGGLGETARVASADGAPAGRGGDLSFTLKVDPAEQNYFTLKFWGEDTAGMTLVDIDGRQIGYRVNSDYEPINPGHGRALPGRFYHSTILLPLAHTRGRDSVTLTLRTYLGKDARTSRGYYRASTHTAAALDLAGEKQGERSLGSAEARLAPDISETEKRDLLRRYRADQIGTFEKFSAALDRDPAAKLSIERYKDELRVYTTTIAQPWSPAKTPAEKRRALERVFRVIDNHTKDYFADIRLLTRGGHQGDWGGYYGALGEALYIAEPLIRDPAILGREAFERFLDEPFTTGSKEGEFSLADAGWDGQPLTRRAAWERVLKANFDFARSRLSYIYNQVLYTYEGAWEAHEGLRLVGSRFFEGKPRSHAIFRESIGIAPFLGEEVLVGPDGRELDLYHSLFKHDREAVFTADTMQVVARGLAKSKLDADGQVVRRRPYGDHYVGITEAGLTRENGYVGTYGETPNYLPEYFYRTLDHEGDEALNDDILRLALRNLHARAYTRYTSLDENGHRIMRMQQVLDERKPVYPGLPAYATRLSAGRALLYASLEKFMAENPARYDGPEWTETWQQATAAVGYAQQQLADHQLFASGEAEKALLSGKKADYQLPATYDYITRDRAKFPRFKQVAAGVVHPLTDFAYYTPAEIAALGVDPADYARFAWVDLDNMMVVLRDGDTAITGVLNFRNRGFTGNGRVHVVTPKSEHLSQIVTRAKFASRDYYLRQNNSNFDYMVGNEPSDGPRPQALAGEICPITYQPGVGPVVRDNFEVDHPYSALPDYAESRYGRYLFVFNLTRAAHGNEQSFEVELPPGHRSASVLDLVSGRSIPVANGRLTIPPKTALVLKLDAAAGFDPKPDRVNFLAALPGRDQATLTWKTAAGAATYSIKRAPTEGGPFETIATGVTGNHHVDRTASPGAPHFYKVAAVNAAGVEGWESSPAKLELAAPASLRGAPGTWRDDRVGAITSGEATVDGDAIVVRGGNGAGLGVGDDYRIETRDIRDSLHFVSQPAAGRFVLEAKVDEVTGPLAGLMLRDQLQPNTRYLYFGADADGRLVLQNRTRDARHAVHGRVISPLRVELPGYTLASHPWLRLERDAATHDVRAFASTNGRDWVEVGSLFTPFPDAVHAGLAATETARFSAPRIAPR